DLLVVAIATNENDDYHRFIRSLNVYGYKYEVIIKEIFELLTKLSRPCSIHIYSDGIIPFH
ncbi:unnamed protein product, partial [Rotaria sp. Silwood2]